jgi:hypothetical protein
MEKIIANSWTRVIHYPIQDRVHASNEPNQRLVDDTLRGLLDDLHTHLHHVMLTMEGQLTLVESDRAQRLERGINENGLIGRDYGKTFKGYYFDLLTVTVKTKPGTKKKTHAFLKPYIEGVIIAYFIKNPSVASNWEYSFRHPNGRIIATTSSPASIINFPQIEIHVS